MHKVRRSAGHFGRMQESPPDPVDYMRTGGLSLQIRANLKAHDKQKKVIEQQTGITAQLQL